MSGLSNGGASRPWRPLLECLVPAFAGAFTVLVGRPPLRYQNEWRLALARDLLAKGNARVGEIGFSIGYGSEAAFSRAYKALFGHSPRVESKLRQDIVRKA